jgi:hypothetical protein
MGKPTVRSVPLSKRMKSEDVALHREGTAKGYLGVDIQRDDNTVTLRQDSVTKRITNALGLDSKLTLD